MNISKNNRVDLIRTDRDNQKFRKLVSRLDKELAHMDGDDHDFYAQFNSADEIQKVVLALDGGVAVGCGGFKEMDPDCVEIKRMYVNKDLRRMGIAKLILHELEGWARELGYVKCKLETGKRQPEAISFYSRSGYQRIENYLQYIGVENSLCFEKVLVEIQ